MFGEMDVDLDEAEHSIELHLPYIVQAHTANAMHTARHGYECCR